MLLRFCSCFAEILALAERPAVIAVDMPIGLPDSPTPGGRACDRAARRLLGRRGSSVFSPPVRAALAAENYRQAIALNGKGLSRQAFNLLPKLREVDGLVTPDLQDAVVEAHPELAFMALAGHPLRCGKKTPEGRAERERLLGAALGPLLPDFAGERCRLGRPNLLIDDVLDACALALTARRILTDAALRLPGPELERDAGGLRMEIWY